MANGISDNNYIVVSGWMASRLELKGNALIVFALIYGFSQDGESEFEGSINYMCNWLNCSRPTVSKALSELVERNLLIKRVEVLNNVTFNRYKVNLPYVKEICEGSKETLPGVAKNLYGGSKETLPGGSKETLHNNTNNKNTNNNSNNIECEKIFELYSEICVSFPKLRTITDARRKTVNARLNKGYKVEDFEILFRKAENSPFLKGETSKWSATFDWLINENNMIKVLEGNYDDKGVNPNGCYGAIKGNNEPSRFNGLHITEL